MPASRAFAWRPTFAVASARTSPFASRASSLYGPLPRASSARLATYMNAPASSTASSFVVQSNATS